MALRSVALAALLVVASLGACGDAEQTEPADDDDGAGGMAAGTGAGTTTDMATSSTTASAGGGGSAPIECVTPHTSVTGSCDLLNQDCPSGQMCNVVDGMAQCVPEPGGLKAHGDDCTAHTECKSGLLCIDTKCTPFCCRDNDQPCEGGICDLQVSIGGGDFYFVCSYAQACTLFADDCPEGFDCHIANEQKGLAVCDPPIDLVEEGGACRFRNNCGDSQQCAGNICRYNCDLTTWDGEPAPAPGQGGCPEGQQCLDLGQPSFPNIGRCMPQ